LRFDNSVNCTGISRATKSKRHEDARAHSQSFREAKQPSRRILHTSALEAMHLCIVFIEIGQPHLR
jgi:hypothetical protein